MKGSTIRPMTPEEESIIAAATLAVRAVAVSRFALLAGCIAVVISVVAFVVMITR